MSSRPGATEVLPSEFLPAVLFAAVRTRLGKWDMFALAMDDTGRTIRLAVILVSSAVPPAALAALAYLLARR
jgi:hypothetical protein